MEMMSTYILDWRVYITHVLPLSVFQFHHFDGRSISYMIYRTDIMATYSIHTM